MPSAASGARWGQCVIVFSPPLGHGLGFAQTGAPPADLVVCTRCVGVPSPSVPPLRVCLTRRPQRAAMALSGLPCGTWLLAGPTTTTQKPLPGGPGEAPDGRFRKKINGFGPVPARSRGGGGMGRKLYITGQACLSTSEYSVLSFSSRCSGLTPRLALARRRTCLGRRLQCPYTVRSLLQDSRALAVPTYGTGFAAGLQGP